MATQVDGILFTPEELTQHDNELVQKVMDAANEAWMRRFQQTNLLTTDEVAERLKRHPNTVRTWAKIGHPRLGKLGFFLEGNNFKISEYDLFLFIEKMK